MKPVNSVMGFIRRNDWEDFLVKFLAVFLGIVITFSGNAYISKKKERKEVDAALRLVCKELKDNIDYMNFADSCFHNDYKAASYLIQYVGHYEDCNADSMKIYCNAPFMSYNITHSEDALELMKTSGLFAKMNPDVALNIIHTYGYIQDFMKSVKFNDEKKSKYLEEAMTPEVKAVLASDSATAVGLWTSMTKTTEGNQFLRELRRTWIFGHSTEAQDSTKVAIERIEKYINR